MINFKKKYMTVDEAEAALGISVESYIDGSPITQPAASSDAAYLNLSLSLTEKLRCLTQKQLTDLILESFALLEASVNVAQVLLRFFHEHENIDALSIIEHLHSWFAGKMGISSSVFGFMQLSLKAMRRLEENNKTNLVLKFCQCLANDRADKSGPLLLMHRMPFGLIQYCFEFFTCTNVMQVNTCS